MKLQQVNNCCCWCSLETGSKIIAWLQIFAASVFAILSVAGMFISFPSQNWEILIGEIFLGYLSNGLFQIGFGSVLLIGIKKKRPDYVNIWICAFVFGIFIYILNVIFEFVVTLSAGRPESTTTIIILVVSTIFITVFEYYCLIVVYSLRKEMLAANDPVLLQEV